MIHWYVVNTQPNGEERARLNLERQGFDVYLPRYLKHRRHARRIERVRRPLFPRYLFVRFDPDTAQWRSINGTFGVAHLVSHGNQPVPVPDNIVDAIQARRKGPVCHRQYFLLRGHDIRQRDHSRACHDDRAVLTTVGPQPQPTSPLIGRYR